MATRETTNESTFSSNKSIQITFFFTAFIAVTYGFGIYLFSVIVSDMKADIGFDYMAVGMITGSAQIAFLLAALLSGIISPRLGAGRVILASVIICGVCLSALGFVRSIGVIAVLLSILGGCAAAVWVPMVEVVGRFIPFKHRSKVLGLMSSGTSYGVFINGLIVPYFISSHHWSNIWMAVGAGTIMMTILSVLMLARSGVFSASRRPHNEEVSGRCGLFSGRNKDYFTLTNVILWAMLLLNGLSCIPFQTYLAPFIRDELMFPVEVAGRIWSIIGFVGMGGGFAIGALSDRTGIRFALTVTYSFLGLAAVLVCFHGAYYQLALAGIAFGLAFYAIFGLVPAYIAKTSTPTQATVVFGIGNVTLGLGSMLGNFVGGWSKTVFGTFLWIYVSIVFIAIISIALSWILPNENSVVAEAEVNACRARQLVEERAQIGRRPLGNSRDTEFQGHDT
jgi:MFS family permease